MRDFVFRETGVSSFQIRAIIISEGFGNMGLLRVVERVLHIMFDKDHV